MAEFTLNFDKEFKLATKALRMNKASPYCNRDTFWKIQVFVSYIDSFLCLICLLYSMIFHDFPKEDYSEGIKNGMIVIVSTSVVLKFYILLQHPDTLANLIEIIEKDYDDAKLFSDEDKNIILKYVGKGRDICKIWLVIATGASMMFPLKAIILMLYYYYKGEFRLVPSFDMNYPEVINAYKYEPRVYFWLLLLVLPFDCFAGTMYAAFDPLVPIFMLHMCGQLDLLRGRILKVFSENKDAEVVKEKLKQINIKLQSIYRFVDTVQNIFTLQYEYNMKTTTFLIPFAAFQIVQSHKNHEFNLEFVFFFIGGILHFYIPCYYSDMLMEKSEKMREAIYCSGWEHNTNIKNRKTILFMLTRTRMPLVIRTIFYPICLDTFAEMSRQSYAIYNIMNAAWG